MVENYRKIFSAKIKGVIGELKKRDCSSQMRLFVKQFFAKMPVNDIEEVKENVAAEIAAMGYDFIQSREPNKPKIRISPIDCKRLGIKRSRVVLEVLNDDIPFLVDSISAALKEQGFVIYETIHPQIYVQRDDEGKLIKIVDVADYENDKDVHAKTKVESMIHFQISPLPDTMSSEQLIGNIKHVLGHVFCAVEDWKPLLQRARDIRDDISTIVHSYSQEEINEVYDFMNWLCNKNFIFLGAIEYDFYDDEGNECLHVVEGSELGIYRAPDNNLKQRGLLSLPEEQQSFAKEPVLIEVMRSNIKSIVHRPVHMEYIAIKKHDFKGKVIGEHRFLGMFASTVYYQSADNIPFIRRKIAKTLEMANFDPASHNGKALRAILEFFPRDELFQITEDDLYEISLGVMSLEARPDVGFFTRVDKYERFVSCHIYVPRDRFSTYIRKQIGSVLEEAFNGVIDGFCTQLNDSPLARLQLIIKTTPGNIPQIDKAAIRKRIVELTIQWQDGLREVLFDNVGEKKGELLFRRFQDAFPKSYMNYYTVDEAVGDIITIDSMLSGDGKTSISMIIPEGNGSEFFNLKIYMTEKGTALSSLLPVIENMGCQVFDVHPHTITPSWEDESRSVIIRDFKLRVSCPHKVAALEDVKELFEEAITRIYAGQVDNDRFNSLVLTAGLSYRQIEILRTYDRYLKQIGLPYSEGYVALSMCHNPSIAANLVELFETRFALEKISKRDEKVNAIREEINEQLANVSNLAEDMIIRQFSDTIMATLRTNFYQSKGDSGEHKDYISLKIASAKVPNIPLPKPYVEIFVYSTRMEGIHLRGGKVARGGLRWSDRPEDFRTEVLGLMKAQMVKNTVIVPVGSKGGFIVKNPPNPSEDREAFMQEGIACYKMFLSGMLDITDNIKNDRIIAPKDVIRHDGDDPYLVVAADKGTATFSDIANSISEDYDFWLGDAFASGGSVGYDHKKMGITARGAWVSVRRHFCEMGIDTQSEDFTVVGIGDMGGDVFGNGMLLSKHIRLVAAFNHMHIFIDPNPDAATSYKERQRLFNLPRSSWKDYDEKLISKGGGVYERSAKSISLSKEAQKLLDTDKSRLSPDEVIRLILKADVDLLWNGGIGTYVKARSESHEDVGDKANNSVRVNGDELRCKVVGEGGNLGLTQLGRIEYARSGGRINTDAIDNSAGVDCSDHEVNIKIALAAAIGGGKLSRANRDKLLADMEDNVAELVLRDNQLQTQAITIAEMRAADMLESHAQMMSDMESDGLLNREVEFLPSEKEISTLRAEKKGLTRPELAVLLSYAKLALYDEILASEVPDSPYFTEDLINYFPTAMQSRFREQIINHRLRREIIATHVTNSIVNRAGITYCHTLADETGRKICDIARAYTIVRDAFGLRDIWEDIEKLDGKVSVEIQVEMFNDISKFMERTSIWFLLNCSQPLDIDKTMDEYAEGIDTFANCFEKVTSDAINKAYKRKIDYLTSYRVPKRLAASIASFEAMSSACDIVLTSNKTGLPVDIVGYVYHAVGSHLQLGWMRQAASQLHADSHWDRMAIKTFISDIYDEQRRMTMSVVQCMSDKSKWRTCLDRWIESKEQDISRSARVIQEMKSAESRDIAMFFVALKHIRNI